MADHVRDLASRELGLLPHAVRAGIEAELLRQTVGFGPLQDLLDDPTVSEVMITSPAKVFVERAGRVEPSGIRLAGERELRELIDRLLADSGRRVDELSPMADGMLSDGSRVNVVIPPLAVDGPQVSVRRFGAFRPSLSELEARGSLDADAAHLLRSAGRDGRSVLISGGTSSGKTTLLAAIAAAIETSSRIVLVEDSAEIPLQAEHLVRLQSRPPTLGGGGEISVRDLVRNALRMRPDRLVIGEVRGPEALDLVLALNTGHRGVLSTLHANSARDAIDRLRDLALLAGAGLGPAVIEAQVRRAIDLVVHLERTGASRRLVEIYVPAEGGRTVWVRHG